MAYIGQNADGNFTTSVSKDTFSGNGSTTAFTLSEAATTNTVDVFVENIRQEPTTAYTVDGTTLTFTAAPVTGTNNIYVVNRGPIQLSASHPAAQSLSAFSATITNDLTVDTNTLFVDASENKVGIGTTTVTDAGVAITPSVTRAGDWDAKLALQSTAASDFPALLFSGSNTTQYGGIVGTTDTSGNVANNRTAQIAFLQSSATAGNITFSTNGDIGSTNIAERMRIDSSGNVGIKETSPSSYYATDLVVKATSNEGGITIRSNATTDTSYIMFADGTSGDARYRGYFQYTHNSPEFMNIVSKGYTRFYTGDPSGERVRILSSGGITFNGDTAAANALDDYEEGTWTPSIGTGTVNAQAARYVKIGQQVTVWGYLQSFSDRSTASAINISGLPFTSASDNYASGATFHRYINANGDMVTAYIPVSTSTMTFYSSVKNSNYVNVLHSHLSSTSAVIFFTISYRA